MKDRFADGFTTYPMPTGSYYSEQAKLHRALVRDERYQKAKSCKHCTDTADSFNRYVSTYCHLKQETIATASSFLIWGVNRQWSILRSGHTTRRAPTVRTPMCS